MQPRVSFDRQGHTGTLTFACDEPGKPITLDLEVLDELATRLDEIQAVIDGLRAIVVQSNSNRYFIVGAYQLNDWGGTATGTVAWSPPRFIEKKQKK